MIKILNAKQLYQADKITLKKQDISSLELMERASEACFTWIHNRLQGNPIKIQVFCGTGNNGGDGLVISRMLKKHGYNIEVYIINCDNKRSDDFLKNYERLKELGTWPEMITCHAELPEIDENNMVIDAIFGIGLNRAPESVLKETIQHINKSNAYVLSIDFPSGLFVDKSVTDKESVVKAYQVLTFQNPKLPLLLPENQNYCVNWEVVSIGLDTHFIAQQETDFYITEKKDILPIYKARNKFTHKGNFGHALIMGGSFGKIGAVSLAARAALHIGSGLVSAYIPKCGYNPIQTSLPEVMVEVDAEKELQFFNSKIKANVIGMGIGMGTAAKTHKGFTQFLKDNKTPLVLDADAINLLGGDKKLIKLLSENTVLTPHPKELERLLGTWKDDHDKLDKLKKFTLQNNLIVVLKGHFTAIAYQGKFYFNTTGNPGLATGGTGDVLTGIITGLIAQGYAALDACLLGVYLHGRTADLVMDTEVYETFTASDVINNLSKAFKELFHKNILKKENN